MIYKNSYDIITMDGDIMGKLEKEVKILNINIKEIYKKLDNIGAKFINIKNQKLYTYDIPTIYTRYLEIIELLKLDNEMLNNNAILKLKILLEEFSDLIENKILNKIYAEMNLNNFEILYNMEKNDILNKLENSKTFNKEIKNKLINPNKWIRLRKDNNKTELTVKHVYEKNSDDIQKVIEYEINVSDFEETNKLLNSIGIIRRNYQEKIRHSFEYKTANIEIDEWPLISPYIEIECDDINVINEIINLLGFEKKDIVSMNTTQVYKENNIDILKIYDLKFNYKGDL